MTQVVLTKNSVVQFLNRFEAIAEMEDFELIQDMIQGTRVLVVENGRLQIIHEHLSRFPKSTSVSVDP